MGTKILTFSYDDGVESDLHLIELWNRYKLQGTVNLNAGLLGSKTAFSYKALAVKRLSAQQAVSLYRGHEIACHTLDHLRLETLSPEECRYQICEDKKRLETLYDTPVVGLAYPFGTYSVLVRKIASDCGLRYARTTESSYRFAWPEDPMQWAFTCRHRDPRLFELADRFVSYHGSDNLLFSVWGHSYEFDGDQDWDRLERFFRIVAGRNDIQYLTNAAALNWKSSAKSYSAQRFEENRLGKERNEE